MVIHAGDFGFYDESSYKHISSRELYLLISHSPYRQESPVDKTTSREVLIEIVRKHGLLGSFQAIKTCKNNLPCQPMQSMVTMKMFMLFAK